MEDFYETRISEVDGQMVTFFGVFDGTAQVFITYPWYDFVFLSVLYQEKIHGWQCLVLSARLVTFLG